MNCMRESCLSRLPWARVDDDLRLFRLPLFNPLAPTLGGDKRNLGTPQTPAAFRCTIKANLRRGALHAPRILHTPYIRRCRASGLPQEKCGKRPAESPKSSCRGVIHHARARAPEGGSRWLKESPNLPNKKRAESPWRLGSLVFRRMVRVGQPGTAPCAPTGYTRCRRAKPPRRGFWGVLGACNAPRRHCAITVQRNAAGVWS